MYTKKYAGWVRAVKFSKQRFYTKKKKKKSFFKDTVAKTFKTKINDFETELK